MPLSTVTRKQLICLFRPPCPRSVVGEIGRVGCPFFEDWSVKRPSRLDSVAMSEEGCISQHRVKQKAFISVRGGYSERGGVIEVHHHWANRHIRAGYLRAKAQ